MASRRRIRAHAEWNVDTHMRRATGPTSAPTRSFISPAALLVNVIARSSNGEMPRSAMRYATRWVSSRVLPEPAPATTRTGPSGALTASRWTGFSPSSSSAPSTRSHVQRTGVRFRRRSPARGMRSSVGELLRSGASSPVDVAERAQQLGAVLVERDGERAGRLVDVEREVRLPVGVQGGRVGVGAQREPTEAMPFSVEEPHAVGRLDPFHEVGHATGSHFQRKRHGAVVHELDLHVGPETARSRP